MSVTFEIPAAVLPIASVNGFGIVTARRCKILIVDDSRLVRSVFNGALASNYECVTAGSYDEAIECLRLYEFDLVLADVIMPGLSGIELLRKIIDKYPDTAVIMVSSIDRPQRTLDALRLGAVDYLIKPCELPVLQLAVERALERRKLILEAKRHKLELEERNRELIAGKAKLQRLQSQLVQNEKMIALGRIAAKSDGKVWTFGWLQQRKRRWKSPSAKANRSARKSRKDLKNGANPNAKNAKRKRSARKFKRAKKFPANSSD